MNINSNIKFILPLTIILVIFASLFFSTDQSTNTEFNPENTNSVKTETPPSNPTPDNVRVLGVEDTKISIDITDGSFNFDQNVIYGLINSYREDNGLSKLFVNKLLENSADKKLTDMVEKNYFRHADNNNNESWYLFQTAGYQYKLAGENLSSGHNTPWQVFSAWQRSNDHNQQMLKQEYIDMGLATDCEVYEIRNKPACIVVLHLGVR